MNFENNYIMKKALFLIMLLALMGNAMAQAPVAAETMNIMLTLRDTNLPSPETLAQYGITIEKHSGRVATATIPTDKYKDFVDANVVERVMVRRSQNAAGEESERIYSRPQHQHRDMGPRHDMRRGEAPRQHHPHHAAPEMRHQSAPTPAHQVTVRERRDRMDDGWYAGILVGDASNVACIDNVFEGSGNGFDLDLRAGYQFTPWFGIRSGLQIVDKCASYTYETNAYPAYGYYYPNFVRQHFTYLQIPAMADFAFGDRFLRFHFMAGGFAGVCIDNYTFGSAEMQQPASDFEAGLAGGLGMTLRLSRSWNLHFEGEYYHGLCSYSNRTWTFSTGLTYHF